MARKNNAVFTKFADVIILETPTPLVSSNVSIWQPPIPLKSADVLYGWSPCVFHELSLRSFFINLLT